MKKIIITIILAIFMANLMGNETTITRVDAKEFSKQIEQYQNERVEYILLDIRTKGEFEQGHLKGALLLDYYGKDFTMQLNKLSKDKKYLIYCRSGNRSGRTLQIMKQQGFIDVVDLKRGIRSWMMAGYNIER